MPGAWAPSTSVSMPRSARAGISRSSGRTRAVGLVTWLMTARRVLAVAAARTRSRTSSGDSAGNGRRTTTTAGSVALGDVTDDVEDGVVLVVGRQDLVARIEPERPHDRVDRAGRVGHEREVVGVGADERAEGRANVAEVAAELAGEEPHGLRFHPPRHSACASSTAVGVAPNDP